MPEPTPLKPTVTVDGDKARINIPISFMTFRRGADGKEEAEVGGYLATRHLVDQDGLELDLDFLKRKGPEWLKIGNIREMHTRSAVGVADADRSFVDDEGLYVVSEIVDPLAAKKCKRGVYKFYSIGLDITKREGKKVTDGEIIEGSLVDVGADKRCGFDLVRKAHEGEETKDASLGFVRRCLDDVHYVVSMLASARNLLSHIEYEQEMNPYAPELVGEAKGVAGRIAEFARKVFDVEIKNLDLGDESMTEERAAELKAEVAGMLRSKADELMPPAAPAAAPEAAPAPAAEVAPPPADPAAVERGEPAPAAGPAPAAPEPAPAAEPDAELVRVRGELTARDEIIRTKDAEIERLKTDVGTKDAEITRLKGKAEAPRHVPLAPGTSVVRKEDETKPGAKTPTEDELRVARVKELQTITRSDPDAAKRHAAGIELSQMLSRGLLNRPMRVVGSEPVTTPKEG